MPQELLNQLRDIHTPAEPSWWPLAIGWWLLILVVLLAIITATIVLIKRRNSATPDSVIDLSFFEDEFKHLQARFSQHQTPLLLAQESSMLLRKISLTLQPRSESLTGKSWLKQLNHLFETEAFTQKYAQVFTRDIYQQKPDIDAEELIQLMQQCIQHMRKKHA